MRTAARRKLDAAGEVLQFQAKYPDPNPAAAPLEAQLSGVLRRADELVLRGRAAEEAARSALAERLCLEAEIRGLLRQFLPLGRVVSRRLGLPGLGGATSDQRRNGRLISLASAVLAWAERHREELLRYGMPDAIIEQLAEAIRRHPRVVQAREDSSAFVNRMSAIFDQLALGSDEIIEHLNALNRIRFAADPARLAEWGLAKKVHWGSAVADAPLETSTEPPGDNPELQPTT